LMRVARRMTIVERCARLGLCAALAGAWLPACGGTPSTSDATGQPAAARALAPEPSHGPGTSSRKAPQRIVSLVPAVTEMLFAIGAGPRVVGVSSFDTYPPEVRKLPRVGALLDPDLERIISLKPDLVIVQESQDDLRTQLGRAGVAAFPYALGGLDNVTRTIRALGAATGQEWQARLVADTIVSRLEALRTQVGDRRRPSTLLVFGREPGAMRQIFVSGGVGFLHDLVLLAGGSNVFGGVRRESLQATTETILAAAPEIVVELRYGRLPSAADLDRELRSWSVLAAVPAVRNRRVYMLVGDELVIPGPRVADTAERIARLLHPEAFAR
jgi:iron complex transport system substrate-binding protein